MNIKRIFRKFKQVQFTLFTIGLTTTAIGIGIGLSHAAAGSGTLTLSPSGGKQEINTTFGVTIYENSSDPVSTVQADFSYDTTKLQFIKADYSTSDFEAYNYFSSSNGKIKISRSSTTGPLTGSHVVAVVNFKALTGSGTTSLTFLSTSALVRSSDNGNAWNEITNGASYTLTAPPTACPAGQTGTPPNCTTPPTACPSGQTGTPPNCTTPPTACPAGQTGTPPNCTTKKKTTTTTTTTDTDSSIEDITEQQADPEAPVEVSRNDADFDSYLVAIKVIDAKGQPVEDADVTLNNTTVKSDVTGIASFFNVPAGDYTVKIHSVLGDSTLNVSVNGNASSSDVQEFEAIVKPKASILPYILLGGLVLLAAGLGIFRKLTGQFPWGKALKNPKKPETSPTVIQPVGDNNLTIEALEEKVDSPHVTARRPGEK